MDSPNKTKMDEYWYPVALSKKLGKKPMSVILLGKKLVIYQGLSGLTVHDDCCPHRKFPLSQGKVIKGELRCGYHGWKFDSDGRLTDLPGTIDKSPRSGCLLPTYSIVEHEHLIWVCLQPDKPFTPYHQDLLKPDIYSYQTTITGDIKDVLENFLDPLHTAFIHDGLIRSQRTKNRTVAEIKGIEHGVEVKYTEESNQTGIIGNILGRHIICSYGRLIKPNIIELAFHSNNGIEMTNRFIIVPTSHNQNLFFSQITFRQTRLPNWLKLSIITPLFLLALKQDKKALKQQSDNFVHFKDTPFKHTMLDIMRPYIDKIQNGEPFVVEEKCIEIYL
ncbi:Rieske 2Fe-2S domain-containing protein [Psychromonas sp. PT13]|uniref:Rieske 2Fe-2S domain-containing protein n=1 Tax=Psychromonas sp. PT13 TaxID=3439547 RepID=UPI003EBB9B3B